MSTYKYTAVDKRGKEVSDFVTASSEADAATQLRANGYFLTNIALHGSAPATAVTTNLVQPNNSNAAPLVSAVSSLVTVIVLAIGGWFYFGGGLEEQAKRDLTTIEQQVAQDAERQYEIAKRNGSAVDAYVQASLVAAAYLQAKDEPNYKRWKVIEANEARRAGVLSP